MRLLLSALRSASLASSSSSSSSAALLTTPPSASLLASSSRRSLSTTPPLSLVGVHSLRRPRRSRVIPARPGRGQGQQTGEGKGRGTKGQNARAGIKSYKAFEGGQTPITLQYPKRGFFSYNRKYYQPVNLQTVQEYIDLRRLDATEPITVEHIDKSNMVRSWKQANGFKLLARGFEKLRQPIHIFPHRASMAAIKAVEAAGGTVTCVYHNRLSFRQAIMPERFLGVRRIKNPFPLKKRDILYYTNWEKRGYLAEKPEGWMPEVGRINMKGCPRAPRPHIKRHDRIARANAKPRPPVQRLPTVAIEVPESGPARGLRHLH